MEEAWRRLYGPLFGVVTQKGLGDRELVSGSIFGAGRGGNETAIDCLRSG